MIQLELSTGEINLILQSLGEMRFAAVFQLVGKIQAQAGEQLPPATPPQAAAVPEANGSKPKAKPARRKARKATPK